MMRIYNSLTRTKEEFAPLKPDKVGMYVCGPTVYDEPHIGHARSAYIFDVIRRYLIYKGLKVKFVRNVTDVDDKIIDKANKFVLSNTFIKESSETSGGLAEQTRKVAEKYYKAYCEDMEILGIGKPDVEPKATEYIPKMIKFIEILIKKGCAYESGRDVYFDIKKAKDYGKLSRQSLDKMEVGARVPSGGKKKDPLDFALWKSAKEGEPSWPSPWGNGRPGWHIECSAMSSDILGDEFDIHGGGLDLIFPHHENEIAQSEGAGKKFAKYWMHHGLLTINNEKMAKSLGNFISIQNFIAKYRDPDYLKLLFLNTHYRHPVDYTEEKISEMKSQKERFVILFEKIGRVEKSQDIGGSSSAAPIRRGDGMKFSIENFRKKFEEAMDDDFNTPLAFASLFDLVTHANKLMQGKDEFSKDEKAVISGIGKLIKELSFVFGLDLAKSVSGGQVDEADVVKLISQRDKARNEKDFKKADDIRRTLSDKGVLLEDTKEGTVWRRKA
ncbi:MAG: cysteine--tRNA ligase [Candidatus Omnitrophota bacterium]